MATLTGQTIASSYEQLLHVDRDGGGNSTTLVSIKDGDNGTTFGFQISTNALMMTSTNQLQFGDTGTYIYQSADGVLDLVSDTEIEINATTIDINGAVDISGALVVGGDFTVNGTTTTVNSTVMQVDDSMIELAHSPSGSEGNDAAINGGGITLKSSEGDKTILWTDSSDQWHYNQGINITSGNLVVAGDIDLEGSIDVNGTANLDIVDIDGAVNMAADLTMGANILMADDTSIGISDSDERIEFDASGDISVLGANFGVGTSSPSTLMHLAKTGSTGDWAFTLDNNYSSSSDVQIQMGYANSSNRNSGISVAMDDTTSTEYLLNLASGGTERFRVTGDGNVGVGASTPKGLVEIQSSTTPELIFNDTGGGSGSKIFRLSGGGDKFFFEGRNDNNDGDGDAPLLQTFDLTNGNVGFGTASPSEKLQLTETTHGANVSLRFLAENDSGTLKEGNIRFDPDTEGLFLTARSGTNPDLFVKSDGNVGIGVTDPDQALEVNGRIHLDRSEYPAFIFTSAASTSWNPYIWYETDSDTLQLGGSSAGVGINITSAGNVGIGTTSPTGKLSIAGASGVGANIYLDNHTADADSANIIIRKSRNATIGSHTIVQDNDDLGQIMFQASDGNSFETAASILAEVDGTPGDGDTPGRLIFKTAADGATGGTERMRINSEGAVYSNTTGHYSLYPSTSASFCAYGFTGDQNTGMYRVGADQLGFATGAGARLILNDNSRISLSNNDGGSSNTVFGYLAGQNLTTNGDHNALFGHGAGDALTTGTENTLLGKNAGGAMTISRYSTAVGIGALGAEDVGDQSTAIGYAAMASQNSDSNNEATRNTGVGHQAGYYNVTGQDNTYIGYKVGNGASGQSNSNNTAVGSNALLSITDGGENVAIGNATGDALTTGHNNVFVGRAAGSATVEVSDAVVVGADAAEAIMTTAANGTVAVGKAALAALTSGAGNVAIGYQALDAEDDGDYNTAIGHQALTAQTGVSGTVGNTAVGFQAGDAITTGQRNTILGAHALSASEDVDSVVAIGQGAMENGVATSGADGSIAIGRYALLSLTSGSNNLAIGYNAGKTLTTGAQNLAIGREALENHLTGESNIAIGYLAMGDTDAGTNSQDSDHNTFIGLVSGGGTWANTTSEYNVGVGNYTLSGAMDGGNNNTAVGYQAGTAITSGDTNALVGYQCGDAITQGYQNVGVGSNVAFANEATAVNQIVIGYGATGTANNEAVIGNTSIDKVYMAQDATAIVHCSGINFPDTQAASADANTLDDYEEGAWTPALAQGGNSVTLSTAVGRYTKIGNTVNFNFYIGASNLGSASGALTLSGLPFTTSNIANNFHAYSAGYGANLNITANAHIAGYSNRNDTTIYLNTWNATTGIADFTAAMLSADGAFMMSGHFCID